MKYRTKEVFHEYADAMQVPPPPKTAQDFIAWGRLGSWLGTKGDWRLTNGVGSAIELIGPTAMPGYSLAKPGDYVVRGNQYNIPCVWGKDEFEAKFEPEPK